MRYNKDIFELWFGVDERPRWRDTFDDQMYQLERKTGLSREQLTKVADTLIELRII